MNNADGRVVINFEFPISEVENSKRKIDKILQSLGENAGEDYKKSFTKNADAVKQHAEKTSKEIGDKLGKDIKSKVDLNTSDAQERAEKVSELYKQLKDLLKNPTSFKVSVSDADDSINKVKKDIQEVPSDKKVKYTADSFDATRKADEIKRKTDEVPTKHNTDFDATDHTSGVFAMIKSHFDQVNNQGKETHSIFKSVFSANIISNAAMGAFGAAKGALGGMIGEAKQYALEQQTMNATWLTLTNSASKGKAMVSQINNMAAAAQNSTHMVDQLSQKFYAINNSAKQTGQLTKAVLTLQDAFGQSDAAVENFGTQFAQMMANGKVSAQDMMSIVNTFPKLKPMLLDYERQIHHDKNMTMSEMSDLMSKGKIKSQDMINVVLRAGKKFKSATGNFTATIPGMKRTVDAEMPRLLQAFEGPLTKMQSPIYGAVAKWVSSKKTASEFDKLGKTVSIGMNNVMKAFGGTKSVNVTKALDNAINGINKGLRGVFGWVSTHAKDLKTIASSITSIGGQIAKSVWADFASIITTIGNMFGLTAKNGKSSSSAIHVIAEALNGLAKNKAAIKAISDAIVAITVVKGLDKVGGGLFSIGEKGYGAYKKLKAFKGGLKGLKLADEATEGEKAWFKFGNTISSLPDKFKGVAKSIHSLFDKDVNPNSRFRGLLQSAHSAGGFKNLSTAGKIGTALAGAGVAISSGIDIYHAIKDKAGSKKQYQDIGKGVGSAIGGGIGLYFFGPLGSAIGAKIGSTVGKWAGGAAKKFQNGWNKNKPPKKFCSLENMGYSAHNMWRGFTKGVTNTIKWFRKNWKEVGLYFVSPLAGAINSLYKHNPKFRKWVNGLVKGFKEAWHGVGKWFGNIGKDIQKSWRGMVKWFTKLGHDASNGLKSTWRSIVRWFKSIYKGVTGAWRGLTSWFSKLGSNAVKGFKKAWHGLTSWFKGIIDGIKAAWDGFWDKISGPLKFIGKIFSGKAKIGGIKFANGTDWRSRYGVPAIVNDAPGDNYREGLIDTDGSVKAFPNKRNLPFWLKPGQDIINGQDMARFFSKPARFATGTVAIVNDKDLFSDSFNKINDTLKGILDESKKTNKKKDKGKNYGSVVSNALHKASYTSKSGAKVISNIKKQLSKIKNRNAKVTITTGKSEKTLARISSQFGKTSNSIYSKTRRLGSAVDKSWKHIWSSANSSFSSFSSKQRSSLDKFSDRYIKGWKSLGSGVKSVQSHAMSDLENITGKGLNKVLSVINSGIGKINSVIKDFGGNGGALSSISPVKYATGTGYRPITKPTFAVVNDGNDSPETGNREALYRPATGEFGIFNGRNVPVMLNPGDEIFSASETKPFINATHFANGTGYLKHLYDLTKKYFAKPKKTLCSMLNYANSTKGVIGKLATGMFKSADKQALNWWSQLWSMVNDKINNGEGPASGLLKAVEELGRGKKYVWGAWGPDSFDCSGLVSRAIEDYYHKHWGRLTVAGLWQHAHRIPRSEAKPGDPVFWLPNHHIGIFDHGDQYWSAFTPGGHPDIGMHSISGSVPGVKPVFGRFDGIDDQGSKDKDKDVKVKTSGRLQKLIKGQVGKGFWRTIQKIADKYGDAGLPNISGNARSWISYIKRAAHQMHTNVTQSDINKIVSMIQGESGGNAKVRQQIDDINSRAGHPAQGLLQFIPTTFAAFAAPGHTKILNGYDQLLALFNDSNWKNDIHYGGGWGPTGHRRYANGGKILFPQFATVGEDGPEYVINPAKPSADRYLLEAIKDRASRAPQSAVADLSKMLDFNQFRYSASNGWRTRSDAHTNNQVRTVTSNGMKGNGGDIHMIVKLNNKTIAKGVKPILDAQQADQIVIAEGGGSI